MGPLAGVRVLELAGLGPGPFAGMVLADLGADVLQVDRVGSGPGRGVLDRGKHRVGLDLKHPAGLAVLLDLVKHSDVLVEVFRAGVAERLGIGPDTCLKLNPRLIYGRLTGYGQQGPYAQRAGHDLNYLAIAGALEPLGRAGGPPTAPINVLADFAGGGLLLALGVTAALVERAQSGRGQVVDAAMVDGAALLLAPFFAGRSRGTWGPRGTNMLDGAAPFYDVYETADGQWMSVAAIEPQFYAALRQVVGLPQEGPAEQHDTTTWPAKKAELAGIFRTRTRDEWTRAFADVDACVEPVLTPTEAPAHPQHRARASFAEVGGVPQPAAAPRFSRTPGRPPTPTAEADAAGALAGWGLTSEQAAPLLAREALRPVG